MSLLHEIAIFQTVKSKVIISLFETVRLSVSISPRNLYNPLKSIKENVILFPVAFIVTSLTKKLNQGTAVNNYLNDCMYGLNGNWVY